MPDIETCTSLKIMYNYSPEGDKMPEGRLTFQHQQCRKHTHNDVAYENNMAGFKPVPD